MRDLLRRSPNGLGQIARYHYPYRERSLPYCCGWWPKAYGATEKDLVQVGRQRKWVTARSMLVFLGREWGRVSVKELGTRFRRDPSVISRLYSAYAAARDLKTEKGLLQQLKS
jgi:hypothetical protein